MDSTNVNSYQVPIEAVNWILAHLNRESKYNEKVGKLGHELSPNRISKFLATMDLSCLLRKELKSVVWQLDYLAEIYRSMNHHEKSYFRRPPSQSKKEVFMEALFKSFSSSKNKDNALIWKILKTDEIMTNGQNAILNNTIRPNSSQTGDMKSSKTIIPNVPVPTIPGPSFAPRNELVRYQFPPKTNLNLEIPPPLNVPPPLNIASMSTETYQISPTFHYKNIPSTSSSLTARKTNVDFNENRTSSFMNGHTMKNEKMRNDSETNGNILRWVQPTPKISVPQHEKIISRSCSRSKTNENQTPVSNRVHERDGPPLKEDYQQSSEIDTIDLTSDSPLPQRCNEKVKIKVEKGAATIKPSIDDEYNASIPRDNREWSLMHQLQSIGFTDKTEIFAGIRGTQSDYGSSSIMEHTDAAMMWIINQREEADEARKMDAVRISSEILVEQTVCEKEKTLQSASIDDILGTKAKKSVFFPHSILLDSNVIQQIFRLLMEQRDSQENAKEEILKYLKLEKDAHKWYGAVTPYCFFRYWARTGIEEWNNQIPSSGECILKFNESCTAKLRELRSKLEFAMFTLSEQVSGGLGNEPKLFIDARRDAVAKGLSDLPSHLKSSKTDIIELSDDESNIETHEPLDDSSCNFKIPTKRRAADNIHQSHPKRSRTETCNGVTI